MTEKEKLALAVLRSGGSFADAMDRTGLTFPEVQKLWAEKGKAHAKTD